MDYHNEFDPYAADWLENLIDFGYLPPGHVDRRSIVDVKPGDLKGYTRCHFFAGIGGWPLALRMAGWPDDRPVWTGSCPCQPFSNAGKRKGTADERHLWPEFRRLIRECNPPVVFGEQVASKDGRTWLAGVRVDLEAVGYAVGAADLCAAGAGAPHIRQRLYWLADAVSAGRTERGAGAGCGSIAGSGGAGGLADAGGGLAGNGELQSGVEYGQQPQDGRASGLAFTDEGQRRSRRPAPEPADRPQFEPTGRSSALPESAQLGRLGDADDTRSQGRLDGPGEGGRADQRLARAPGQLGFWSRYDVVHCTDGKARRFEPGSFPLAHGIPNRVGRLRGYGNAIVPQVAAEFVGAYMDAA